MSKEPEAPPGADLVVSATEFKAKCLGLMDRVKRTRETIVITKHGTPVARLVPPAEKPPSLWGCMAGTGRILGDIVGPTTPDYDYDASWEDDWTPAGPVGVPVARPKERPAQPLEEPDGDPEE